MGQTDTKTKTTLPALPPTTSPGFCQVLAQYRAQLQPSLQDAAAVAPALSKIRQ